MQILKSISQPHDNDGLHSLLRDCLALTYNAVHFGEEHDISNRKGMKEFYRLMRGILLPSCYKLGIITRACSILESRKKSNKRGFVRKRCKPLAPAVCITSGFFVTAKGSLFIPTQKRGEYAAVVLNHHVWETIEGAKMRSLSLTSTSIIISFQVEAKDVKPETILGVDRNLGNLAFGNPHGVVLIDTSRLMRIQQTAREIVGSCKRNDVRIRAKIARKYWRRASNRSNQILHAPTNIAVAVAVQDRAALVLEDLTGIRKMYKRKDGQSSSSRFQMNLWPYGKIAYQLKYKSAENGLPVIQLTKAETRGSSIVHWSCGERLYEPERGDQEHRRMLWCQRCKAWVDRDVNAAVVLSTRGLSRFDSSLPRSDGAQQRLAREEGLAGEAVKGNGAATVPILRVDASKLLSRRLRTEPRLIVQSLGAVSYQ